MDRIVEVTTEEREELKFHMKRTGLDAFEFWNQFYLRLSHIPWYRIERWVTGEKGKARRSEIEAVLSAWRVARSSRIPITDEIREELRAERDRTNTKRR